MAPPHASNTSAERNNLPAPESTRKEHDNAECEVIEAGSDVIAAVAAEASPADVSEWSGAGSTP